MTTTTMQAQRTNPLLLILLVAFTAFGAGALLAIAVQPRDHAVAKHGIEAELVREACEQFGPSQVWKDRSWRKSNQYYQVCDLDDGRMGIRIIRCIKGAWIEATAFVPSGALGNGTPERVLEYLSGKARPFAGRLSDVCR